MPERGYILELDAELLLDDYLRVWIRTDRGTVVDFVNWRTYRKEFLEREGLLGGEE